MSRLSDEKLLKRALHGAKSLRALAAMASLLVTALLIFALYERGRSAGINGLVAAVALMAIGFWTLSSAAKRGNPTAVGIVLVVALFYLAATIFTAASAAAHPHEQLPVGWLRIALIFVIVVDLARARGVLLELRKRGLWQQVFGAAKPSSGACVVGGILFVLVPLGSFLAGVCAAREERGQRQAEMRCAQAFGDLVLREEDGLKEALRKLDQTAGAPEWNALLKRADELEAAVQSLLGETAGRQPLASILTTYRSAVQHWRKGWAALIDPHGDRDAALKLIATGDRLRGEATREFDRCYAKGASK